MSALVLRSLVLTASAIALCGCSAPNQRPERPSSPTVAPQVRRDVDQVIKLLAKYKLGVTGANLDSKTLAIGEIATDDGQCVPPDPDPPRPTSLLSDLGPPGQFLWAIADGLKGRC